jgi:hypothetical protein
MPSRKESPSTTGWSRQVGRVIMALTRYRVALRRAARRAGDPLARRRLRGMAGRRRRDVTELTQRAPAVDPAAVVTELDSLERLRRDDRTMNEIASLALCLRSNRRLRVALERALRADVPSRVARRLDDLRGGVEEEFGLLNARLRDIAIVEGPPPPE